ncbi:MAG: hypothetical protein RXP91_06170 [Nitrososphaeria archaeon]
MDRAAEGEEADRGGRVDALLFLSRALGARKDKPVFAVEGALRELGLQCYHGTLGDGSGVERPSGSLKGRTSASFKGVNAGEVEDRIAGHADEPVLRVLRRVQVPGG